MYPLIPSTEKRFRAVIVIPCHAEAESLPALLNSLSRMDMTHSDDTSIIFVLNNSICDDDDVRKSNADSFNIINEYTPLLSPLSVFVIDAYTPGHELPEKEAGVGLARKIGMDAALQLFHDDQGLLVCLDADCTVSPDYLSVLFEDGIAVNVQAGCFPFFHPIAQGTPNREAIIVYEIYLRYYLAGLRYSASPHTFHTIGSTMICSPVAYAAIGGMNKRKAAEDFYFMEKLSKSYPVIQLQRGAVYPSSRVSLRVPFGTGQRVHRFLSGERDEYLLYPPALFAALRDFHQRYYDNTIDPNDLADVVEESHPDIVAFLQSQGFREAWGKIAANSKSSVQIRYQKQIWMDSFRTLKLVHYLRDHAFPMTAMVDALQIFTGRRDVTELEDFLLLLREADYPAFPKTLV